MTVLEVLYCWSCLQTDPKHRAASLYTTAWLAA